MGNNLLRIEITFSPRYSGPTVADAPKVLRSQLEGELLERVEFKPEGIAVFMGDAGDREVRNSIEQLLRILSGRDYYVDGDPAYFGNHSFGQPR